MKATEPIWTQAAASRQDRNAATLARWIMRERPADVHNQAGLLRLLNGDKLVALTETRTGARQTHRRKPAEPDRGLAWELVP
jgi:hypothetical protein